MASTVLLIAGCAAPGPLSATIEGMLDAGPGRDSSTFRHASAFVNHQVAGLVLAQLVGADDPPAPDGVRVLDAVDAGGRPVTVVTEELSGSTVRGLGIYAVRTGVDSPPRLVVEVPHPRADRWTESLGAELFASLDAEALLVAGAHRTAGDGTADVAREPASTFAAVDRAVTGPGTVVLQLHGFDASRHSGDAQVVLSSGVPTPGPALRELDAALEDAGFDTCVYDGERCKALAGTRNVQGAHARTVGATFIHLELAAPLRRDEISRSRLVEVLRDVLGA